MIADQRIDSIFLAAVKANKKADAHFEFCENTYRIAGHGKSWPRLSFGPPLRSDLTRVRDFWIKPDCILERRDGKNPPSLIVIEVCKSWQNFTSKRYQYCNANKDNLCLFNSAVSYEEIDSIDVVYALQSDTADWMLSRIINMPDCGGRFVEGIENWNSVEVVDIQRLLAQARIRDELVGVIEGLPLGARGKARAKNLNFISALGSVKT